MARISRAYETRNAVIEHLSNHNVLARRLKSARLAAGLSQRLLGIAAGIDEAGAAVRVNRYENGVHAPDFNTAMHLARALNVPAAYFFCETEELADVLVAFHRAEGSVKEAVKAILLQPPFAA